MTTESTSHRRELDHRSVDGIEVTLWWTPATDVLHVAVHDVESDPFEVAVGPHEALDAFHHPFAYAARRPLDLVHA